MSLSKRMFTFIQSQHITINAFEKRIGVSQGLIAKAIKNETSIGSDKLWKIFQSFPDINLHWLITGNGLMLLDNERDIEYYGNGRQKVKDEVVERYERDIKRYLKEIDMLLAQIEKLEKNK